MRAPSFLLLSLLATSQAWAGPLEELRAASGLDGLEPRKLLSGEIIGARGTQGDFSRGIYAQSCYYVKASAPATGEALLHWNPAKYKESEVNVFQLFHWPAPVDVFKDFTLLSTRPADRTLLDGTISAAHGSMGDFHLRPVDGDSFRDAANAKDQRDARVSAAWQQLLLQRAELFATGGLAKVPAYTANGATIEAGKEFKNLLKMAPAIGARFAPLTESKWIHKGAPPAPTEEVVLYGEDSLVNGHTGFCLGFLGARKSPTSWQVIDCSYYTSDTYFLSIALYQLWPWENGTLVWEVDYASAPFRAYLAHIDKTIAGNQMVKETAQAVQLLRRDMESRPK